MTLAAFLLDRVGHRAAPDLADLGRLDDQTLDLVTALLPAPAEPWSVAVDPQTGVRRVSAAFRAADLDRWADAQHALLGPLARTRFGDAPPPDDGPLDVAGVRRDAAWRLSAAPGEPWVWAVLPHAADQAPGHRATLTLLRAVQFLASAAPGGVDVHLLSSAEPCSPAVAAVRRFAGGPGSGVREAGTGLNAVGTTLASVVIVGSDAELDTIGDLIPDWEPCTLGTLLGWLGLGAAARHPEGWRVGAPRNIAHPSPALFQLRVLHCADVGVVRRDGRFAGFLQVGCGDADDDDDAAPPDPAWGELSARALPALAGHLADGGTVLHLDARPPDSAVGGDVDWGTRHPGLRGVVLRLTVAEAGAVAAAAGLGPLAP